jgi:hypothetical protein
VLLSLLMGGSCGRVDEGGGMDLIGVFPSVIALRVAPPFDEILQGPGVPPSPVTADLLHFILFFPCDQVGWWSCEVGSM